MCINTKYNTLFHKIPINSIRGGFLKRSFSVAFFLCKTGNEHGCRNSKERDYSIIDKQKKEKGGREEEEDCRKEKTERREF